MPCGDNLVCEVIEFEGQDCYLMPCGDDACLVCPEEIDENRAMRSAEQAKEALLQKKSIQDYHAAEAQMARAISRLHVKGKSINL